ncbi:hypothetical protein, partial [Salmonella enterica]|uniref:hypothetical protein n=2 Tax=Salmonella enterica TaxID=28901 RepID=UPI000A5CC91F
MHSWKKKLVVSQLALACTLAITSQANATTNDISGTTYNTFHHYNDATYADDVYYDGYVGCGFAPIFPDICYHLTHYKPAAADIPV